MGASNGRTKNIQSIKLSTTRDPTGHIANISGWGKIIESGSTSVLLRAVDVNIIDQKYCNDIYYNKYGITKNMTCAGSFDGGKDSCQG